VIRTSAISEEDNMVNQENETVEYQFPLGNLLFFLGLEKKLIELKGKKVLDVGCGADARLVYFLRSVGVNAGGIDPCVTDKKPFLIRRRISRLAQDSRNIPRPDGFYDLVVSHSVPPLMVALTSNAEKYLIEVMEKNSKDFEKAFARVENSAIEATTIVVEAMRVLKGEGRYICYPGLDKIHEVMGQLTSPYNIINEPVMDGVIIDKDENVYGFPQFSRNRLYRTIITKK
jgi:hypothetical protein